MGQHEATRTQSTRGSGKYTGLRNIAELTRLVTIPGAHEALSSPPEFTRLHCLLRSFVRRCRPLLETYYSNKRKSSRDRRSPRNPRTSEHGLPVRYCTSSVRLSNAVLFSGPKPGRGPPLRSVLRIPNNSLELHRVTPSFSTMCRHSLGRRRDKATIQVLSGISDFSGKLGLSRNFDRSLLRRNLQISLLESRSSLFRAHSISLAHGLVRGKRKETEAI